MTDCAWPNGFQRSYYPPDQSHSCGSLWNNRAWATNSGCTDFLTWGMAAGDLPTGQSYRVFATLMMSEYTVHSTHTRLRWPCIHLHLHLQPPSPSPLPRQGSG